MTMRATLPMTSAAPPLRMIEGGARRAAPWWEQRAMRRQVVGGCPDHWWKPTAPRTVNCTCDRF